MVGMARHRRLGQSLDGGDLHDTGPVRRVGIVPEMLRREEDLSGEETEEQVDHNSEASSTHRTQAVPLIGLQQRPQSP